MSLPRVPSPRQRKSQSGPIRRFLMPESDTAHEEHHDAHSWHKVLWLTGVDYFSTLGYQPGIAFLAAGALAPIATLVLIVVTLAGAYPVYAQVARRSFAGQGSIAMLERMLPGWISKLFVLVLLGFAATDFVITMTLSAADAAQHAVENPLLHKVTGEHKITITLLLLIALAGVFLKGFREAIGVARVIAIPYLLLNVVVIARSAYELAKHPELFKGWTTTLAIKGNWPALLVASILIFPRLALGMSGFETGVSVMPLVAEDERLGAPPAGRIGGTRRLLLAAALIMSVALLGSSLVTTTLIPAEEFAAGGKANGRALAYLAHGLLGTVFGTVYDAATIAILWFAGASAMAGMLALIPRYLPRFGMAPKWVEHPRPLILLLLGIDVVVTLVFKADVDAQGGAYATGVLVLMLSAAVAVALALWREARDGETKQIPWASLYFWGVVGVFTFTLLDNVIERPDGVIIASIFIVGTLVFSGLSRFARATELRVEHHAFVDDESAVLFEKLHGKKVNLLPLRDVGPERRKLKVDSVRRHYHATGEIAFVHIVLADDTSEFKSTLRVRVRREETAYVITVEGAVAVANTIAWISEQLDPIALYLGLSLENPFTQAFKYLLWGEGETGILVYEILVRYWHTTEEDDVRPYIFLVSD